MSISVENSIKLYIGADKSHFHEIFVIPHSLRHPEWPGEKTICLVNIPAYITEDNLKGLFSKFGNVEKVAIFTSIKDFQAFTKSPDDHKNSQDFRWKIAFMAFKTTTSVDKVLQAKKLIAENVLLGVQRWISNYKAQYPSSEEMQSEIESFMAKFDQEKRAAEQVARNQTADDEGWVQVSRKSSRDAFKLTEKSIQNVTEQQEAKKKRKELKNFYRFQVTESKKQRIVEMRKKFQEDKQKVEKMKSSRRFRPF
ncbi:ribosomal RNA-processing protein 7 homolog A [Phlebotomus argentipes]|uniref:ribosomal RNA-processing protein 7 homolog A n=1 Tax=Phlebotomus argentipes TaxID=94469 RepID=UPI0028938104|nr:ribosomal RNA-processing protein 7 homolog A [Phlebotomus argentipes]